MCFTFVIINVIIIPSPAGHEIKPDLATVNIYLEEKMCIF